MLKVKDPQTTLTGIVLILAGIGQFFNMDTLAWDFQSIVSVALPVVTGFGFLKARDADSEE